MTMNEMDLTDANFEATTGQGVVLIDFWAPRCGPCRTQGPIIEKMAAALAGQARVRKCNVDEEPTSSERFGIRNIPTLVILKEGREVERFVGLQSEADLMTALRKHI